MAINMPAGIGTHMDAPSHCFASGKCIHEFEVNDLCMPCVVIDISSKAHERYSLSIKDIKDFEQTHGTISPGTCVMVNTGWDRFWGKPEKYRNAYVFPSITSDAADLLLNRGTAALGIDTLSPDRPEDGFGVHSAFLSQNKILIENATNLNKLPPVSSFIMFLPLKIKDGTEAPVRLVGLTLA